LILGRETASATGGWPFTFGQKRKALTALHNQDPQDPNHLRFGEVAAEHNMNYVADATFGGVRVGGSLVPGSLWNAPFTTYETFFTGGTGPAALGRYLKEGGAAYVSPLLPAGGRPVQVAWTEIPADLWFDGDNDGGNADGWMGDASNGHAPRNDQFGPGGTAGPDGKRDVRIDLELWETDGLGYDVKRASLQTPGFAHTLPSPAPGNRLYYKAVFVNDWDDATRLNNPLDVTPFLDDVTIATAEPGGGRILAWEQP
jgi:hypothetical protein